MPAIDAPLSAFAPVLGPTRGPAVVPSHHPAELSLAVVTVARLRVPEPPLLSTELLLEFQGI